MDNTLGVNLRVLQNAAVDYFGCIEFKFFETIRLWNAWVNYNLFIYAISEVKLE